MSGPHAVMHPWRQCNSSWGLHIEYLVLNRDGYGHCWKPRDFLGWHWPEIGLNRSHGHRANTLITIITSPLFRL
jgi:hypothetical protein